MAFNGKKTMRFDRRKEGPMVQAGRLTTHVLDTAAGRPAAGLKIALYRVSGNSHRKVKEAVTNADGRCDEPLLEGKAFQTGQYELIFFAGDYLRAAKVKLPE